MSKTYLTGPSSFFTSATGVHLLEAGVSVDTSSAAGLAWYTSPVDLLVHIDGTSIETDTSEQNIYMFDASTSSAVVGATGTLENPNGFAVQIYGSGNDAINHGTINARVGLNTFGSHNTILNTGTISSDYEGAGSGYRINLGGNAAHSGGSAHNSGTIWASLEGACSTQAGSRAIITRSTPGTPM